MKLTKQLLTEMIIKEMDIGSFSIDIEDVKRLLNKRRYFSRDEEIVLEILYDQKYENPEETQQLFDLLTKVGKDILTKVTDIPYVDIGDIKQRLLTDSHVFDFNEDVFYPFPIYVSANKEDKNTIGIEVSKDGKFKMFEGNDEASPETIEMVNDVLGIGQEKIKVYGSHNSKLVDKIKETNILPKGLYVSPNRGHAEGYWGEDRVLFSCVITKGSISQESEVDFKVIKDTQIEKFRYV